MSGAGPVEQVALCKAAIRDTVTKDGVAVVRHAGLSPADFVTLLREFGALMFTEGETPVDGHPDLNIVTNKGRVTKPKSVFHSDTTYVRQPPSITALLAIDVPKAGGATVFSDQYAAYDALPASMKSRLDGARVLHRVTGVTPGPHAETECWHPLVRVHPDTGRSALFLTTPARCFALELADGTTATDLIEPLYDASIRSDLTKRHLWSEGDVLFWDNRCTMHAADHSAVVGDRTLYRGMVQGEIPNAG
ncbi:MAG: TauD/TfdA family dioxygenase [Pseudomonadota bacterium]